MTPSEAEKEIERRLQEHPQIVRFIKDPQFIANIKKCMQTEGVGTVYEEVVVHEVILVLAICTPLSQLSDNIAESTGLSSEVSGRLAQAITVVALAPLEEDLEAIDGLWNTPSIPEAPKDLRERLELRPDVAPVGGARPAVDMGTGNRPLSREEVLSALSPRRTMTGDIQSIQQRTVPPPPPPAQ